MYKLLNEMADNIKSGSRKDIYEMLQRSNQYDVRISKSSNRVFKDEQGRDIIDFASGNYLGFDKRQNDLLPGAIKAVEDFGLHTGRARLTGHFDICRNLEDRLSSFIGSEDSLIVTNTFLGSIGIIPALIEKDDLVIMDKQAHAIMFHGAQLARDKGAMLKSYPHDDLDALESLLKTHKGARHKLICLDAVYSITGNYLRLMEIQQLAHKYNAILFVDDAHGFGMVGKNTNDINPYGDGSGIVNHLDLEYDNILYIAGTAKNMSSAMAFAGVSKKLKETLLAFSRPLDYSQQPIPFAFGILNSGLDLLEKEGDQIKQRISSMTMNLIEKMHNLGFSTFSKNNFPIVSVKIPNPEALVSFSRMLFDKYGLYVTSCPYPTMAKGEECIRITVTDANTPEQIDKIVQAFEDNVDFLLSSD
ncbi:aminotransferase class I/II-fold pyridoxal phosphate-dependent enzyme [Vibrio pectenicida]|uniref:Pyridoxal phosphate-dependent aminotransferase family protein n=1 Tax=Vibrio pectenicida TaxID=62763 RepID=A0A3R9KW31_9VIBR|nr:pyridoxal phosphate-dependent aminotransferase family protein [Vibrio pectenicida]RSD27489.1 pyridoxal phosphate-dependent aminotransferase family protein [Vibrio pectenicida]